MAGALKYRGQLAVVSALATPGRTVIAERIAAIAALGAAAIAGRCAIALDDAGAECTVLAPVEDSRWSEMLVAALGALNNRLSDSRASGAQKVALSARELAAIARGGKSNIPPAVAILGFIDGASVVRIVLAAGAEGGQMRSSGEYEALLELLAGAVFAEIARAEADKSREFWRAYGAERIHYCSIAKKELARERGAARELEAAVAAMRAAGADERFARFGEIVAAHSGFEEWIVAIAEDGKLKLEAASPPLKVLDLERTRAALEESFRRREASAGAIFADRLDRDPERPWLVCIPFEAGAIALGLNRAASAGARARAEKIVGRLGPIVTNWAMEREAAARSGLVRKLALRMFAASDDERARIARDLHDDQAQLIAAAKIALDGGREEARAIFGQIETELRRKTRELRPATLGRATLDEAIEREFRRLAEAGIGAKLARECGSEKISRPVQQLCFQVVREALSNVIRHARAKSVEVIVERTIAAARISVIDDGRGIDGSGSGEGNGLAGVRERLELMGGRLTIESRAGRTSLVAEIPGLE